MKIIIISHNYRPEDSGIGLYSTQMAEFLAQSHEVNVFTGFPYYPKWEIAEEYRKKPKFLFENINGVGVHRYKMYTPKSPTFIKRVMQMFSFLKGSHEMIKSIKEADLVLVVVPFTLSVIIGRKLARRLQSPFWIHVQDFEFDAALETGILSKIPILPSVLLKFEKLLFHSADRVSSISHAMLNKLNTKTNTTTEWIPNWIEPNSINPGIAQQHPFFKNNKKNILYSGNIGAKQDWETYIGLVKSMEKLPQFHFILIGDGAMKNEVLKELGDQANFSYYPPVPYEKLNDVICSADLHILPQKPQIVDTVMPSKLLGMMASAKPSLVSGNETSEVKVHIESGEAGKYIITRDVTIFQEEILKLLGENASFNGEKARNYVIDRFSKEKVLSYLQKKIETIKN